MENVINRLDNKYMEEIENCKQNLGEFYDETRFILPVTIIDGTVVAANEYLKSDKSGGCGDQIVILTTAQIEALQSGKGLAISPHDEYDVFIIKEQK